MTPTKPSGILHPFSPLTDSKSESDERAVVRWENGADECRKSKDSSWAGEEEE
jgi:hypothetical protein